MIVSFNYSIPSIPFQPVVGIVVYYRRWTAPLGRALALLAPAPAARRSPSAAAPGTSPAPPGPQWRCRGWRRGPGSCGELMEVDGSCRVSALKMSGMSICQWVYWVNGCIGSGSVGIALDPNMERSLGWLVKNSRADPHFMSFRPGTAFTFKMHHETLHRVHCINIRSKFPWSLGSKAMTEIVSNQIKNMSTTTFGFIQYKHTYIFVYIYIHV